VAAKWSFQLTNAARVPLGEIKNATDRKAKLGIRQLDVASFKIRADNELFLPLFAEDVLLQVWQGSELRFWGPVLTPEFATDESGGEPTIAVNAVSPMWRLSKRLSGKLTTGSVYGASDKGAIAKNEIDSTNGVKDTGIETEAVSSSGSSGAYTAGPYRPVLTCIRELANGFDGFDWRCKPLPESGAKIGKFELAAVLGTQLPDIVFEYGCGKHNMRSMTFKRDIAGMLNSAYHITDNGPADPAGIIQIDNAASQAAYGLYEGVVEAAGLYDETLRKAWARENVEVRGVPRLIATMTSDFVEGDGRTPEPFIDYAPGDFVKARARSNNVQLFDNFVRCYNVEVAVDESGTPTYTPTIVEEEGEGAE
jgi:hypothetical protein